MNNIITFKSKEKAQPEKDVIANVYLKDDVVTVEMTAPKIVVTRMTALRLALLLIAAASTNAKDIIS